MRPGQLKKIQAMTDSPYFNTDEALCQLVKVLMQFAPDFDSPELTKENIFKLAFPKQKYDEKKLSYILSDILSIAEQYVVQERFKEQSIQQQFYLLMEYTALDLEKHYRSTMSTARKDQKRKSFRDADFFYDEFLLEAADNAYFDKQRSHRFDKSLQLAIDNLDIYFLTLKLKYSCEILNRRNVVASDYEIKLLDEILRYIDKHDFNQAPAIQVYYSILMTLKEPEKTLHFEQLKKLLKAHTDKFSSKEARDMYAYAQNYCIKQVNNGNMDYLKDLFQLYKMTIDSRIIFFGKHISPWTYKNITSVALRLEEFQWAEQFVENYKEHIESDFRKDAYAYNMASIYFDKKDFEKAQELLQDVEFSDLFYSLDSKAMMLRIYYELEVMKPLASLLDSFRVYLKRNKQVSDYQRTLYLNLIKYVREASKLRPHEKELAKKLKNKIEKNKNVAYLKWVKDIVDRKLNS
ncbi:MAG: hypothetical protein WD334_07315 [Chitinophagales bacterium]